MKLLIYLLVIVLLMGSVFALESDYEVILKENGQALVLITLEGEGVVSLPFYDDVEDINVKGGLYLLEDNNLDVSIGSSGGATVAFVTNLLTKKQGEKWQLELDVLDGTREIKLHAPENLIVIKSDPNVLIEKDDVITLYWQNNINSITLEYKFDEGSFNESDERQVPLWAIFFSLLGIIVVALGIYVLKIRKKPKENRKEDLMRTLLKNERTIVTILLNHEDGIRRNELERESQISKSSLASSLYNLERKKLIDINKNQTVHFIKLKRWFYEL